MTVQKRKKTRKANIQCATETEIEIEHENEVYNENDKKVEEIVQEAIFCNNHNDDDNDDNDDNCSLFLNEKWYGVNDLLWSDEVLDDDNGSDEQDSDHKIFSENDKSSKIYHGHTMSIYTSMILILLYSVSHNISAAQLNDLLTLISLHCLHPHPGLRSIYMFKQFFVDLQSPIVKHYYCSSCFRNVNEDTEQCPNEKCQKLISSKNRSYFIEVQVKHQIRKLLEKEGFVDILVERFKREKKNEHGIEDLYDVNI